MLPSPSRSFRVLAVDDNTVARRHIASQLSSLGYAVTVAESARDAQAILIKERSSTFDCLVTDCCMPGETGFDLLRWLNKHDYTLASVVVSAAAGEEVVEGTLRSGASDFVRKPVLRQDLGIALSKAIGSTLRRRRTVQSQIELRDAGLLQRRMNNLYRTDELPVTVTICYHPKFQAGGDSVAFFPLDADRMLVLVADVSGHDLKSALLSAYFRGMLLGMLKQNVPISEVLDHFNHFLVHDWLDPADGLSACGSQITSLAVCSALINLKDGNVTVSSRGAPLPARIDQCGIPWTCEAETGYPLGWFDPNPAPSISVPVQTGDHLVIWTDGLEDFANQLQISPWGLAYRLLATKGSEQLLDWLADAPDDVLLVHAALNKSDKLPRRIPVLAEAYEKRQLHYIDDLQQNWQRTLQFALPELGTHALFDILLCIREAVINSLIHGCCAASDVCSLTVVVDMDAQRLRVDVSDPGDGHQFDFTEHEHLASEDLIEEHRGLLLIYAIADSVEQERCGASIRIFFKLPSE